MQQCWVMSKAKSAWIGSRFFTQHSSPVAGWPLRGAASGTRKCRLVHSGVASCFMLFTAIFLAVSSESALMNLPREEQHLCQEPAPDVFSSGNIGENRFRLWMSTGTPGLSCKYLHLTQFIVPSQMNSARRRHQRASFAVPKVRVSVPEQEQIIRS
ncbi:uncharacterized protein B0I36DRAFT_311755 [Microdochium trichocladiopsis]|uniref:Uncharacterized protein n=1 Tax=Microdochium trichocladiopsis TaxID=1682393 RepID=A0A9P9BWL6_9PEZI|nr:uncharacterized protein B0I36DRAFT_311755 [Microdochium trichocladiopsis]KAH7040917.1 hypothetical protein B0I36DRAFT_311755 [Microdochium trichocladiopsis]